LEIGTFLQKVTSNNPVREIFPLAYLQSLISVVISYLYHTSIYPYVKMKFLVLWILSVINTHCQVITLNGAWRGIINICGKYY